MLEILLNYLSQNGDFCESFFGIDAYVGGFPG
jgi:hypothetical protein